MENGERVFVFHQQQQQQQQYAQKQRQQKAQQQAALVVAVAIVTCTMRDPTAASTAPFVDTSGSNVSSTRPPLSSSNFRLEVRGCCRRCHRRRRSSSSLRKPYSLDLSFYSQE